MKYDYTWRCDCNMEGETNSLTNARNEAREHFKIHFDKIPNWTIFIDEYNLSENELSGKYWKIIKNK